MSSDPVLQSVNVESDGTVVFVDESIPVSTTELTIEFKVRFDEVPTYDEINDSVYTATLIVGPRPIEWDETTSNYSEVELYAFSD